MSAKGVGYKSQGQAPNNVRRLASIGFARTRIMSAKGAEYKSQGQAPNNVRRLASIAFARTRIMSAKGAEYKSQGQAPNNVRRVAPGTETNDGEALKERNNRSEEHT